MSIWWFWLACASYGLNLVLLVAWLWAKEHSKELEAEVVAYRQAFGMFKRETKEGAL